MPTLEGAPVKLRIKPGTQSGSKHRVKGRGVATKKRTGDLIVTTDVVVPTKLSDAERAGGRGAGPGHHGLAPGSPGGVMRMRTRTQAVYVISVAAELAGMHPQTLRIYERKGLLEPARTAGGNRRYSDEDIERLRRISDLAAEGMNLAGIRRVMELEEEVVRLRAGAGAGRRPPPPTPWPTPSAASAATSSRSTRPWPSTASGAARSTRLTA